MLLSNQSANRTTWNTVWEPLMYNMKNHGHHKGGGRLGRFQRPNDGGGNAISTEEEPQTPLFSFFCRGEGEGGLKQLSL